MANPYLIMVLKTPQELLTDISEIEYAEIVNSVTIMTTEKAPMGKETPTPWKRTEVPNFSVNNLISTL